MSVEETVTSIHEQTISLIDDLSASICTKDVHKIFPLFSLARARQ